MAGNGKDGIIEPEVEQAAKNQTVGAEIRIRLDPVTHRVSIEANMPDEILTLGMLELAKIAFIEESRRRATPRIAVPPAEPTGGDSSDCSSTGRVEVHQPAVISREIVRLARSKGEGHEYIQ